MSGFSHEEQGEAALWSRRVGSRSVEVLRLIVRQTERGENLDARSDRAGESHRGALRPCHDERARGARRQTS